MKKPVSKIIMLFLLMPASLFAQDYFSNQAKNSESAHLVLMHPTVSNIKTINNLLKKEILSPGDYNFVGVYHSGERYNYDRTIKYLDTAELAGDFYLHYTRESIHPDKLYGRNKLSDDFKKIFLNSEGVIFFGGPDMPPFLYGERTSLLTNIYDPNRHYNEASFLFHLIGGTQNNDFEPFLKKHPDYFILGICLGMQTMNVASGGTLYQDIPSEIYKINKVEALLDKEKNDIHRNYYNALHPELELFHGSFHKIVLKNEFPLKMDQEPLVYSNHHQGIEKIGKEFEVAATSLDGKVIEAIRHKYYPNVIGIQFHPEPPYLYDQHLKYYLSPEHKEPVSGHELLKRANSCEFHYQFWQEMAERLNKLANSKKEN